MPSEGLLEDKEITEETLEEFPLDPERKEEEEDRGSLPPEEELFLLRQEVFLTSYNLLKTVQTLADAVEKLYSVTMGFAEVLGKKGIIAQDELKKIKKSNKLKEEDSSLEENTQNTGLKEEKEETVDIDNESEEIYTNNKSFLFKYLPFLIGGGVFILLIIFLLVLFL